MFHTDGHTWLKLKDAFRNFAERAKNVRELEADVTRGLTQLRTRADIEREQKPSYKSKTNPSVVAELCGKKFAGEQ